MIGFLVSVREIGEGAIPRALVFSKITLFVSAPGTCYVLSNEKLEMDDIHITILSEPELGLRLC
jgi:hypothetical protein